MKLCEERYAFLSLPCAVIVVYIMIHNMRIPKSCFITTNKQLINKLFIFSNLKKKVFVYLFIYFALIF